MISVLRCAAWVMLRPHKYLVETIANKDLQIWHALLLIHFYPPSTPRNSTRHTWVFGTPLVSLQHAQILNEAMSKKKQQQQQQAAARSRGLLGLTEPHAQARAISLSVYICACMCVYVCVCDVRECMHACVLVCVFAVVKNGVCAF